MTEEVEALIRHLAGQGEPKAKMARLAGVSRPTVYAVLEHPMA